MTRSILLTAAFAALTVSVVPSIASADDTPKSDGQISTETLAQFGLGDSAAVSDEEGLDIRGKAKTVNIQYKTSIKPLGKRRGRKILRKRTKNRRFVAKKLKPGRYSVSYKAVAKRGKNNVSKSNSAPPVRVSVPGRR